MPYNKGIDRSDVREGIKVGGLSMGAVVAIIAFICVVVGALWWGSVMLAGVKGDGNVHKDQQDAKNREHWSAVFNAEYTQIEADKANIETLREAAKGSAADKQDLLNYTGAKQACQADVAEYNGNTGNTLAKLWIPDGLPTQIDASTYCK